MSSSGKQVKNGKAFEYAILTQYVCYLREQGVKITVVEDKAYKKAKLLYEEQPDIQKAKFDESARATIETIVLLEPGLTVENGDSDVLRVYLAADSDGQDGDVRDIVFERPQSRWEVGFSAKNNHEAVKHSRVSGQPIDGDFGKKWVDLPCSHNYWVSVRPVFDKLLQYKTDGLKWSEVPNKLDEIYYPFLCAFKDEMQNLNAQDPEMPKKLIGYLVGRYPFYKIIKDDAHNLVVVKAFNLEGKLNQRVNGESPRYKTPKLNFPSRIVEFDFKKDSKTSLIMIMDEGWEISFRIHSAEREVIPSLKFDIQLLGNPPILFTQHLFQ